MKDVVIIPSYLKINAVPGSEVLIYDTYEELAKIVKKIEKQYILFIYEKDYKPETEAVKKSSFTVIIGFDEIFEQVSNSIFKINGEKVTSFSILSIVTLLRLNLDYYNRIIDNLQIGISLTVEKDPAKLYGSILTFLRKATGAQAGTLYLMSEDKHKIFFVSSQNSLLDSKLIEKREVPFNRESLVGYVCYTGKVLNIPDAYDISKKAKYHFNDAIDKKMNYKTVSIITVPMKTAAGDIVGAVQLINKNKDAKTDPVPFGKFDEMVLKSLSTLAAVSVQNNNLLVETETLLNNMIVSSVKAIEQRDPATKGHSLRVAAYTVALLKRLSKRSEFKDRFTFDRSTQRTAEIAALLHDFGKVGVREKILMKQSRIYPETVEAMKWRLKYILVGAKDSKDIDVVAQMLEKIDDLNVPRPHSDEEKDLIEKAGKLVFNINGEEVPLLLEEERKHLNIARGTLDPQERADMERHVKYSYELLSSMDWPYDLRDVPKIASSHHEKLDGSGYPCGKDASSLGITERVMMIVDIYDALTAKDRPYKKAMPAQKALSIIEFDVKAGKLDKDVYAIFLEKREEIEREVKRVIAKKQFDG